VTTDPATDTPIYDYAVLTFGHRLFFAPDTDDCMWGEAKCSCGVAYPFREERLRRSTPVARAELWHNEHVAQILRES